MTSHDTAAAFRWSHRHLWMLALGFVLFPAPLFAIITITVESVQGSRPMVGNGTPVVVLDYGTVSAFGPVAAGVSRTVGASDYALSSGFGVKVTKIIGGSSSYTLRARVTSPGGVTWRVDGVTMSTTPATVATVQPYSATIPHTLTLVVPFSRPEGIVGTLVEVIAVAN